MYRIAVSKNGSSRLLSKRYPATRGVRAFILLKLKFVLLIVKLRCSFGIWLKEYD
jgi:hypothetical protein